MTARFLISGASGLLGTSLVRELEANQISYLKLVRHHEADADSLVWNPEVDNPIEDRERLEGVEVVVHLSGANLSSRPWSPEYRQEIFESRVVPLRALSRVLAGLKQKPQVLITASAVGYYGERGDEVVTEKSSLGEGFLPYVCDAWERASREAETAGIRTVHTRFGVVLAKEGGALKKLLMPYKAGVGGVLGSGRQWMSWVTLEDTVQAILFLAGRADLRGAFNVTSPNPVRNVDFTRALGDVLDRPTILPVPASILKIVFGQMAKDTMLASTRAVPERLLEAGYRFHHGEIRDALQAVLRSRG